VNVSVVTAAGRVLGLLALVLAQQAGAVLTHAHPTARPVEAVAVVTPDAQLSDIYAAIDRGAVDEALRLTDKLIAEQPNFRLAYLIRGDLLLAHVAPLTGIGSVTGGSPERIEELREEALLRLKAYRDKPAANMVPRYLLELPPDEKTAVIIDTRRSRLYVYENVDGHPRFLADYYVTQGKYGADKAKEGDMRTPVGVYHVTSVLPKSKLPDFFGAGALPINYPNEWDRLNGRTGHGIWLHGTPRDTYARAPKDSDGCVVLANADWRALFHTIQIGVTPVIISDDVEWLKLDDWNAERTSLQHAIESWRSDWESRDVNRYLSHYSTRFASDTEALRQWSERKRQVNAQKDWIKIDVRDISMLRYPGKEDIVVVTFDQSYRSNNMSNSVKKRQYWTHEGKNWKILYEGVA
jgi:murein L,D-transpeptidase YafK